MTELTKLYPMVQIKKNTWEIDEFDCASIFLLIGTVAGLAAQSQTAPSGPPHRPHAPGWPASGVESVPASAGPS